MSIETSRVAHELMSFFCRLCQKIKFNRKRRAKRELLNEK